MSDRTRLMMRLLDDLGEKRAVLIAGPTASGKSRLALDMAKASREAGREAVIVNADSMQVYDALRILSARPGAAEEAQAPHRLYGHVPAATRYSVGRWLADAAAVLREAERAGSLPILVGGTGLYFKALTEGLTATPEIPAAIRTRLALRLKAEGAAALHKVLGNADPETASAIRPSDPQRILRALEILEATGRPLAEWRRETASPPLLPLADAKALLLVAEREALYRRIESRLDAMIEAGALDEVSALLRLRIPPDLPTMKAIGVREFRAVLSGERPLAEALRQAKQETRRYAKRQMTWFRNQMRGWEIVDA